MSTIYASKRAYYVKRRDLKPAKKTKMPENNIPVIISPTLTVYINDESKREQTILKYKNK